jgi:hypothetical protein
MMDVTFSASVTVIAVVIMPTAAHSALTPTDPRE